MDNLETEHNNNNIKQLILNTKIPLLIAHKINCDLTTWNLQDWTNALGNELLQFRCGKNQYSEEPQWESTCRLKEATFTDFLKHTESNDDDWWYFDYKYLCQWFTDKESLKQKINWSALGFPEISSNDTTLWIGSKGAHTSCHMDTYGCNIVLQLFGKKQWILFPPEQNLRPTRIPFEESSIYSKLNFFTPKLEQFKGINRCHKIVLKPGNVLIVPNKWWHYVENLETAISINAWLPLPHDDFERIKESVATIFVRKLSQNEDKLEELILNPNMTKEMVSFDDALRIISASKQNCRISAKRKTGDKKPSIPHADVDIEKLLDQSENISKIPVLNDIEFKEFLTSQSERFSKVGQYTSPKKTTEDKSIIDFLDVIIDNEVLELIAKKLIERN